MNIRELAGKTGIPLKTLRKLEALKIDFGKLEPEGDFINLLRIHLGRNQQMTVAQLLHLHDEPSLIDELGAVNAKYAARARDQMRALNEGAIVSASSAPKSVTAEISQAARCDDASTLVIAEWLMTVLPVEPVTHHWVAVRLLAPLNEFLREQDAPLITLTLLNVRRIPEFRAWWRSEKIKGRSVIKYSRPPIANMDL